MLVLKRKLGEKIMIARDIAVTVVSIAGKSVRLGIEAPRDVSIYRKELLDPKQEEGGKGGADRR